MIALKGMTWSHPRGFDPMVATSAEWQRRTGVAITWEKRSLQDFESFSVEELAKSYDLIVIDHPHVGQITEENCLAPLDLPGREAERAALGAGSVGLSYPSYEWQGRQWAFPIDAAAQVQAYRADLLERPAETWDEVVLLARAGHVVLPMLPPHSLMCVFTLAANIGNPCATSPEEFIDARTGAEVLGRLAEITALIEPSNFAMDPIAASEALARDKPVVLAMPLGYGYANYAGDGFRANRLTFCDIPALGGNGPVGSALGGTGIAVSAFSKARDAAIDYAYWVASGEVQKTLYAQAGGQPGHATAWSDAAVNAPLHGFYRHTRRTLDTAYLRPRHNGYMAFQDAAAKRLNAGLLTGEPVPTLIDALNQLYRESF